MRNACVTRKAQGLVERAVRIRAAHAGDKDFILGLAPRLVEFGEVSDRERSQMIARDRTVLLEALEQPSGNGGVFVAEDGEGRTLGFIHLTTADDYYSETTTAHIADIAVTSSEGGRGVGTALMNFAEQWARQRGFAMLTLNVFGANRRARALYSTLGFTEEWIRCIKWLRS
jgi:GNAT superfamily N-acetyltransferase